MMSLTWWLNLGTFLGIAILAVPVWDLNVRKRKLHQVQQAEDQAADDSDFRARARAILSEKHKKNVAGWRARDQICLIVGYLLLLGASAARVVFPSGAG